MTDYMKYIKLVDQELIKAEKLINTEKEHSKLELKHYIEFMHQYCKVLLRYLEVFQSEQTRARKVLQFILPSILLQRNDLAVAAMKSFDLESIDFNQNDFIVILDAITAKIIENHGSAEIKTFLSSELTRANYYLFLAVVLFVSTFVAIFMLIPFHITILPAIIVLSLLGSFIPLFFLGGCGFYLQGKVDNYGPIHGPELVTHIKEKYCDTHVTFEYRTNVNHDANTLPLKSGAGTVRYTPIMSRYCAKPNDTDMPTVYENGDQVATNIRISHAKRSKICVALRSSLFGNSKHMSIVEYIDDQAKRSMSLTK